MSLPRTATALFRPTNYGWSLPHKSRSATVRSHSATMGSKVSQENVPLKRNPEFLKKKLDSAIEQGRAKTDNESVSTFQRIGQFFPSIHPKGYQKLSTDNNSETFVDAKPLQSIKLETWFEKPNAKLLSDELGALKEGLGTRFNTEYEDAHGHGDHQILNEEHSKDKNSSTEALCETTFSIIVQSLSSSCNKDAGLAHSVLEYLKTIDLQFAYRYAREIGLLRAYPQGKDADGYISAKRAKNTKEDDKAADAMQQLIKNKDLCDEINKFIKTEDNLKKCFGQNFHSIELTAWRSARLLASLHGGIEKLQLLCPLMFKKEKKVGARDKRLFEDSLLADKDFEDSVEELLLAQESLSHETGKDKKLEAIQCQLKQISEYSALNTELIRDSSFVHEHKTDEQKKRYEDYKRLSVRSVLIHNGLAGTDEKTKSLNEQISTLASGLDRVVSNCSQIEQENAARRKRIRESLIFKASNALLLSPLYRTARFVGKILPIGKRDPLRLAKSTLNTHQLRQGDTRMWRNIIKASKALEAVCNPLKTIIDLASDPTKFTQDQREKILKARHENLKQRLGQDKIGVLAKDITRSAVLQHILLLGNRYATNHQLNDDFKNAVQAQVNILQTSIATAIDSFDITAPEKDTLKKQLASSLRNQLRETYDEINTTGGDGVNYEVLEHWGKDYLSHINKLIERFGVQTNSNHIHIGLLQQQMNLFKDAITDCDAYLTEVKNPSKNATASDPSNAVEALLDTIAKRMDFGSRLKFSQDRRWGINTNPFVLIVAALAGFSPKLNAGFEKKNEKFIEVKIVPRQMELNFGTSSGISGWFGLGFLAKLPIWLSPVVTPKLGPEASLSGETKRIKNLGFVLDRQPGGLGSDEILKKRFVHLCRHVFEYRKENGENFIEYLARVDFEYVTGHDEVTGKARYSADQIDQELGRLSFPLYETHYNSGPKLGFKATGGITTQPLLTGGIAAVGALLQVGGTIALRERTKMRALNNAQVTLERFMKEFKRRIWGAGIAGLGLMEYANPDTDLGALGRLGSFNIERQYLDAYKTGLARSRRKVLARGFLDTDLSNTTKLYQYMGKNWDRWVAWYWHGAMSEYNDYQKQVFEELLEVNDELKKLIPDNPETANIRRDLENKIANLKLEARENLPISRKEQVFEELLQVNDGLKKLIPDNNSETANIRRDLEIKKAGLKARKILPPPTPKLCEEKIKAFLYKLAKNKNSKQFYKDSKELNEGAAKVLTDYFALRDLAQMRGDTAEVNKWQKAIEREAENLNNYHSDVLMIFENDVKSSLKGFDFFVSLGSANTVEAQCSPQWL